MRPTRRLAAGLLAAGALLAVGTPAYVSWAAPHLAGYLRHWSIFVFQFIPYGLFAAIWLPRRSSAAAAAATVLAALLLAGALILYVPVLWAPRAYGGDMVALFYVATSLGTTAAVLIASGVAAVVLWLRRRRASGQRAG